MYADTVVYGLQMIWEIEWSCDRLRHMTLKGQGRHSNTSDGIGQMA